MADYYAPTAFDSTKPRELPPRVPRKQLPLGSRAMRGNGRRLPWGIYVGDERNGFTKRDILRLQTEDEATLMALTTAECLSFPTIRNPKMAWALLRGLSGIFFLAIVFTEVIVMLNWGIAHELENLAANPSDILLIIVPLLLFIIGSIALPRVENKNNILLNRRTGIVTLPGYSEKKRINIPFDEFDPYIRWISDPKTGGVYWRLHLGHRASLRGFEVPGDLRAPAYGYQNWEFIQQFMDISRPLPDRPSMEPIRHLDPTTVAYDKAFGRPRHFWRDQDPDEVRRQAKRIKKIILDFPWEYLPHNIEPYDQYRFYAAWPLHYPEEAKIIKTLENTGWWHTKKPAPPKKAERPVATEIPPPPPGWHRDF